MTTSNSRFSMSCEDRLPVPKFLFYFMMVMFGLPAVMVFLTTIGDIGESPWLIFVYLGSWMPVALLFGLKHVLSRYAVHIQQDHTVEIVHPFKTQRFSAQQIDTAGISSVRSQGGRVVQYYVVLGDSTGKALASFSATMFTPEQIEEFFQALQHSTPTVNIVRS